MRRVMLIGPSGCGKTTFCQALYGLTPLYKKTQVVDVFHHVIDTPGEYLENNRLNRALAVTATQADVILLMQEWNGRRVFPPGFATMFHPRPVCGVICKADTAPADGDLSAARMELTQAGVSAIFVVSSLAGTGMGALRIWLWGE